MIVGYDQELLISSQALQDAIEADDVRIVEGGINFIEDIERTRIDGLKTEQERERGQRPFSTGKQRERLETLAGCLRKDLHTVIEWTSLLVAFEAKRGPAAREQFAEEFLEIHGNRLKNGAETAIDVLLEVLPQLAQLRCGLLEIAQLGC
jgi:hypothetical protein